MKNFLLILPMLFFMTACSSTVNVPANTSSSDEYIGLTIEEASKKAMEKETPFRVVTEDGRALPTTKDYRIGRINATVENGMVKSYDIEGKEALQPTAYSQDSWKTMIPESCTSFFDGCNSCSRMVGGKEAACTLMYCETYEKPMCKDGM